MTTGLPGYAWPPLHDLARTLARWIYCPAFEIRTHGLARVPRTGPVVLIANHSSMIEPQLIFGMLRRRSVFLVKEEMFHGFVGWGLHGIGQLPVRRGQPDRAPMFEAVRILRGGGVIGVFPEGSRGEGDVANAEPGAAWLVRSSSAVVIPVAVRGTRPPADGRRRLRPLVDILIGEPFSLTVQRGRSGLAEATERMRLELARTVHALDEWRDSHGIERKER